MSTTTRGEPEPSTIDEKYPLPLLRKLLQEMIRQFGASGGCIAFYDENTGQMVIRLHMRVHSAAPALAGGKQAVEETAPFRQRVTIDLADPSSSGQGGIRRLSQPLEVDPVIALENSALFPIGMAYAFGQDLIGYTWRKNEPIIIRHDDYISSFQPVDQAPFPPDFVPSWYLSAPIQVPEFSYETHERKPHSNVFGIVVLYQAGAGIGFQQRQRIEAMQFTERIALYIENDRLRHLHLRTR
ncbi:MAG TPA: hypothetical protein VJQ26_03740, partial [Ktedonobacteraceae bacterium]|nr:hypothetical protein [Ktedonobacteraceae bacterium]